MLIGPSTHGPDQARGATCVAMVKELVGSDLIEEKIPEIQKSIDNHPPGSR